MCYDCGGHLGDPASAFYTMRREPRAIVRYVSLTLVGCRSSHRYATIGTMTPMYVCTRPRIAMHSGATSIRVYTCCSRRLILFSSAVQVDCISTPNYRKPARISHNVTMTEIAFPFEIWLRIALSLSVRDICMLQLVRLLQLCSSVED